MLRGVADPPLLSTNTSPPFFVVERSLSHSRPHGNTINSHVGDRNRVDSLA